MKTVLQILILPVVLSAANVFADDSAFVFVNILSKYRPQELSISGESGKTRYTIKRLSGKLLLINDLPRSNWQSGFKESRTWVVKTGKTQRQYRGAISVASGEDHIIVVNKVRLEDYLIGVLAGELAEAEPEALKAQAILARTLIYRKIISRNGKGDFDIGDLTNEQVYAGYFPSMKFANAVKETQNMVITFNGELIEPFWHSTCGSRFISPKQAWNGPQLDYLISGKINSYYDCHNYPHFSWQRQLSRKKISKILGIGKIGKQYPQLFENGISLGPENPGYTLERFRLAVNRVEGWNFLKSNDYSIQLDENMIIFSGFGLGHNIGLCQCQAMEMAKDNLTFHHILTTYYKGIQIVEWNL